MAHQYTIQELERLVAIEQGGGHKPSRDRIGHDTSYAPPPKQVGTPRKIYDAIYKADGWVQRSDIAKALGLKKTKWLNDHIEQLVSDGHIVKTMSVRYNGATEFWYAVARS